MSLKAYSQIPPRVLWRELEIILQAPRKHQASSGRVPGELRESCKGAPGELHRSSKRAPEELQESPRGAQGDLPRSCRRAPGELQESSTRAPGELHKSSRRAPGELQARAQACTNKRNSDTCQQVMFRHPPADEFKSPTSRGDKNTRQQDRSTFKSAGQNRPTKRTHRS